VFSKARFYALFSTTKTKLDLALNHELVLLIVGNNSSRLKYLKTIISDYKQGLSYN
jgi:hypothetical protein